MVFSNHLNSNEIRFMVYNVATKWSELNDWQIEKGFIIDIFPKGIYLKNKELQKYFLQLHF